jgi:hypothetical protein
MRDLLRHLPDKPVTNDPMARTQYPAHPADSLYWPTEVQQTIERLDFWLPNMALDHRYQLEEIMQVTKLPRKALEQRLANQGVPSASPAADGRVKVLPYPGGRHPRIGFLDGAIDPLRGTKVSIFPPWANGGYVVLDLPEAIFSSLGLIFLAHTHIPTLWDAQNALIENRDWVVEKSGDLHSAWRLPNGIAFGAQVTPQTEGAAFELWLENGTGAKLSALRTQVCLMLKAAPGFNEQNQERKQYEAPLVVVKAAEADRYLLLAFEQCGRAWGNESCPCVHSDPVLPNAAPGERVSVRGLLRFYAGTDIATARQRLLEELPQ